jgi:AcrR family transcriptional regulator
MAVAASEGLATLSMSRVAAELGASTMSLYRYVAAKDELLVLMVDAALGPPPPVPPGEKGWRAGLSRWAWACRDAYRRHEWALRIPISGPPVTPNQIAWLEDGLRSLRRTRLSEQEKLSAILLLSGFVRSAATLAADIGAAHAEDEQVMRGFGALLSRFTDPERFPALHTAIAAGAFDDEDDIDAEFVFGLERVLDGIGALVRASRSSGAGGRRSPGAT